jgi:hypothetical protein
MSSELSGPCHEAPLVHIFFGITRGLCIRLDVVCVLQLIVIIDLVCVHYHPLISQVWYAVQ